MDKFLCVSKNTKNIYFKDYGWVFPLILKKIFWWYLYEHENIKFHWDPSEKCPCFIGTFYGEKALFKMASWYFVKKYP